MHWSDDDDDDEEEGKSDSFKGGNSSEDDSSDDDDEEEDEFPSPSALATKTKAEAKVEVTKKSERTAPPAATVRRRKLAPTGGISSSLLKAWTPEGSEEREVKAKRGQTKKGKVLVEEEKPRRAKVEVRTRKTKASSLRELLDLKPNDEENEEEEEKPRRTRVELRTRKTKVSSLRGSLESKPEEEQEYVSAREEVSILEDVSMFDETFHSCESEEDPQDENDDDEGSYTERGSEAEDDGSDFELEPPPRRAPATEPHGRPRGSGPACDSSQRSKKTKAKTLEDRFSRLRLDNTQLPPPRSLSSTMATPDEESISSPPSTPPKTAPPRPKGLVSPSKLPRIPNTPHRPSTDMFWSQEFVEDWNDQHSPAKQLFPSSKPPLAPPATTTKPSKPSKPSQPSQPSQPSNPPPTEPIPAPSPAKKTASERQALKAFEAARASLAESFLSLLDTRIASSQISSLSASTGGIKIIWSRTLATTAGRANWRKETYHPPKVPQTLVRHHASIELSTKVITTPDRLYNVLAHEFCHLCNFMISGVTTNPHGREFKAWGEKVTREFGGEEYGVEVTTKHTYEIEFKYVWSCEGCGMEYKRHSKSVDVGRHRCAGCKGGLVQIKPTPRGQGAGAGAGAGAGGEGKERKQSAYQVFMKEEMRRVRGEQPGLQQKEVMRVVAERWRAEKERVAGGTPVVEARKELPVRGKKEIEVVDLT
ncbi:SprT-like family-domain-containing protein [Cercophora samala]|uniref:SprT-like family-domain-containing protein n=1 Tax=Cercophora samala TaxID=330535 RepID=A0AA39ZM06_9PEZI|nr:SprT-like family-domain-containing protein [Cercophora samala]